MSVVTSAPARKGRIPELLLLIIALGIGLLAYFLVHIGTGGSGLPDNFTTIAAVAGVVVAVAHLAIRWTAPYADPILFPAALLLNGLGLAMIYRIDLADETGAVKGQLQLTVVSIVLMTLTVLLLRNHRILRNYMWVSLVAGIGLLLLPMVPGLGKAAYGARIWISLGGFSFQPAELAKIFFAIFFAAYLAQERDNLSLAGPKILGMRFPKMRHVMPILLAWGLSMGVLALEKDFGTALLFFGLFVALLYVATERVSWLVIGGTLAAVGIFAIVQMVPHIQARFVVWQHALDPDVYDAQYGSYQLVQGLFGMASGGLFGTGFGEGYPTKSFAANSDFIVASFGEEIGLTGLLALLCIYLIIVIRGIRTAIHLRDGFGKLLATGLSFTVALQCFVVVGGVTRLIPLTGLAMPFLAHGGSALLTNWIIIGLLLRMSDASRRPANTDPLPPREMLAHIEELPSDEEDVILGDDDGDSQLTEVVRIR